MQAVCLQPVPVQPASGRSKEAAAAVTVSPRLPASPGEGPGIRRRRRVREIHKITTSARSNGEMCRIPMETRKSGGCGAIHAGHGRPGNEEEAS